jgi:mono/diheme cytochrome c family protein
MPRIWRPVVVGALVAFGVFLLAQAQIFEPSADTGGSTATGDATRGAVVFERECAGCHGVHGTGGSGPALRRAGFDAAVVREQIREGGGIMPAALVMGQDEADVVAYVVSIAKP